MNNRLILIRGRSCRQLGRVMMTALLAFNEPSWAATTFFADASSGPFHGLERLDIPPRLGTLTDRWTAPHASPTASFVVLLEDLHGNREVQHHLEAIIERLYAVHGIQAIYSESSFGRCDPSVLRTFASRREQRLFLNHLLDRTLITGDEMAAAQLGRGALSPVPLVGIDDPKRYLENVRAYHDLVRDAPQALPAWRSLKAQLWSSAEPVLRHHLFLTEKLLDLQLTDPEWQEYQRTHGLTPRGPPALQAAIADGERFYRAAELRSPSMAQQLLAHANETPRAVVVTGGFHSAEMARQLKASGISYAVVAPTLEHLESEALYRRSMLEPPETTLRQIGGLMFGRLNPVLLSIEKTDPDLAHLWRQWNTVLPKQVENFKASQAVVHRFALGALLALWGAHALHAQNDWSFEKAHVKTPAVLIAGIKSRGSAEQMAVNPLDPVVDLSKEPVISFAVRSTPDVDAAREKYAHANQELRSALERTFHPKVVLSAGVAIPYNYDFGAYANMISYWPDPIKSAYHRQLVAEEELRLAERRARLSQAQSFYTLISKEVALRFAEQQDDADALSAARKDYLVAQAAYESEGSKSGIVFAHRDPKNAEDAFRLIDELSVDLYIRLTADFYYRTLDHLFMQSGVLTPEREEKLKQFPRAFDAERASVIAAILNRRHVGASRLDAAARQTVADALGALLRQTLESEHFKLEKIDPEETAHGSLQDPLAPTRAYWVHQDVRRALSPLAFVRSLAAGAWVARNSGSLEVIRLDLQLNGVKLNHQVAATMVDEATLLDQQDRALIDGDNRLARITQEQFLPFALAHPPLAEQVCWSNLVLSLNAAFESQERHRLPAPATIEVLNGATDVASVQNFLRHVLSSSFIAQQNRLHERLLELQDKQAAQPWTTQWHGGASIAPIPSVSMVFQIQHNSAARGSAQVAQRRQAVAAYDARLADIQLLLDGLEALQEVQDAQDALADVDLDQPLERARAQVKLAQARQVLQLALGGQSVAPVRLGDPSERELKEIFTGLLDQSKEELTTEELKAAIAYTQARIDNATYRRRHRNLYQRFLVPIPLPVPSINLFNAIVSAAQNVRNIPNPFMHPHQKKETANTTQGPDQSSVSLLNTQLAQAGPSATIEKNQALVRYVSAELERRSATNEDDYRRAKRHLKRAWAKLASLGVDLNRLDEQQTIAQLRTGLGLTPDATVTRVPLPGQSSFFGYQIQREGLSTMVMPRAAYSSSLPFTVPDDADAPWADDALVVLAQAAQTGDTSNRYVLSAFDPSLGLFSPALTLDSARNYGVALLPAAIAIDYLTQNHTRLDIAFSFAQSVGVQSGVNVNVHLPRGQALHFGLDQGFDGDTSPTQWDVNYTFSPGESPVRFTLGLVDNGEGPNGTGVLPQLRISKDQGIFSIGGTFAGVSTKDSNADVYLLMNGRVHGVMNTGYATFDEFNGSVIGVLSDGFVVPSEKGGTLLAVRGGITLDPQSGALAQPFVTVQRDFREALSLYLEDAIRSDGRNTYLLTLQKVFQTLSDASPSAVKREAYRQIDDQLTRLTAGLQNTGSETDLVASAALGRLPQVLKTLCGNDAFVSALLQFPLAQDHSQQSYDFANHSTFLVAFGNKSFSAFRQLGVFGHWNLFASAGQNVGGFHAFQWTVQKGLFSGVHGMGDLRRFGVAADDAPKVYGTVAGSVDAAGLPVVPADITRLSGTSQNATTVDYPVAPIVGTLLNAQHLHQITAHANAQRFVPAKTSISLPPAATALKNFASSFALQQALLDLFQVDLHSTNTSALVAFVETKGFSLANTEAALSMLVGIRSAGINEVNAVNAAYNLKLTLLGRITTSSAFEALVASGGLDSKDSIAIVALDQALHTNASALSAFGHVLPVAATTLATSSPYRQELSDIVHLPGYAMSRFVSDLPGAAALMTASTLAHTGTVQENFNSVFPAAFAAKGAVTTGTSFTPTAYGLFLMESITIADPIWGSSSNAPTWLRALPKVASITATLKTSSVLMQAYNALYSAQASAKGALTTSGFALTAYGAYLKQLEQLVIEGGTSFNVTTWENEIRGGSQINLMLQHASREDQTLFGELYPAKVANPKTTPAYLAVILGLAADPAEKYSDPEVLSSLMREWPDAALVVNALALSKTDQAHFTHVYLTPWAAKSAVASASGSASAYEKYLDEIYQLLDPRLGSFTVTNWLKALPSVDTMATWLHTSAYAKAFNDLYPAAYAAKTAVTLSDTSLTPYGRFLAELNQIALPAGSLITLSTWESEVVRGSALDVALRAASPETQRAFGLLENVTVSDPRQNVAYRNTLFQLVLNANLNLGDPQTRVDFINDLVSVVQLLKSPIVCEFFELPNTLLEHPLDSADQQQALRFVWMLSSNMIGSSRRWISPTLLEGRLNGSGADTVEAFEKKIEYALLLKHLLIGRTDLLQTFFNPSGTLNTNWRNVLAYANPENGLTFSNDIRFLLGIPMGPGALYEQPADYILTLDIAKNLIPLYELYFKGTYRGGFGYPYVFTPGGVGQNADRNFLLQMANEWRARQLHLLLPLNHPARPGSTDISVALSQIRRDVSEKALSLETLPVLLDARGYAGAGTLMRRLLHQVGRHELPLTIHGEVIFSKPARRLLENYLLGEEWAKQHPMLVLPRTIAGISEYWSVDRIAGGTLTRSFYDSWGLRKQEVRDTQDVAVPALITTYRKDGYPLLTTTEDGRIQNRYEIKIVHRLTEEFHAVLKRLDARQRQAIGNSSSIALIIDHQLPAGRVVFSYETMDGEKLLEDSREEVPVVATPSPATSSGAVKTTFGLALLGLPDLVHLLWNVWHGQSISAPAQGWSSFVATGVGLIGFMIQHVSVRSRREPSPSQKTTRLKFAA